MAKEIMYRGYDLSGVTETVDDFRYTVKQLKFCHAVVQLGNYSDAYRKAYDASKMKPSSIGVKASEMMAKVKFQLKCEEIRADLKLRNELTLDEIVKDLASMVRFDIADMYDEETGALKAIHDMPVAARKMIASVDSEQLYDGFGKDKQEIGTTKKLKLHNRLDVLEKLMKYFDGYNKHNQSKKPTNQVMIVQLPENNRDLKDIDYEEV